MASTAQINIKVDEKDAQNSVGKLNQSLQQTEKTTASLRGELRQVTQELQGLEPGSKRFDELSQRAGELRDTIQDTNAVINATAGSAIENLGGAFNKLGGIGINAFQGIVGAQAMMGNDSEELIKLMAKLQGAMAIGEALKGFGELDQIFVEIKSSLTAAATKLGLFTTVEEGATVGTKALGLAMKSLPIIAIIAGITTLVAAIYSYNNEQKEAEKQEKKRIETLKKQNEAQKRYSDNLAKEVVDIKVLAEQVKMSEPGSKRRVELIKEMNEKYGTHLTNIKDEAKFIKSVNNEVKEYVKLAEIRIRATLAEETATKFISRENELRAKSNKLKKEAGDIDAIATKNAQGIYEINKKDEQISIARLSSREQDIALAEREEKRKRVLAANEANRLAKMADDAAKYADNALVNAAKYGELTNETETYTEQLQTNNKVTNETVEINKQLEEALNVLINTEKERISTPQEYLLIQKEAKDEELKLLYKISTEDKKIKDEQLKQALELNQKEYDAKLKILELNDKIKSEEQDILVAETDVNNKKIDLAKTTLDKKIYYLLQLKAAELKLLKEQEEAELLKAGDNEEEKYKIQSDYALKRLQLEDDYLIKTEEVEKQITENQKEELSKRQEALMENMAIASEQLDMWSGKAMEITSAINELFAQQTQQQIDMVNNRYQTESDKLQAQFDQKKLSDEEYNAQKKALDQQREQDEIALKRKQFNRDKANNIVNAIMLGAQSVLAALATMPPASYIMAGINAGLAAVQVATISQQQFKAARGGIVPGNGPSNIDSVPSLLAPGEAVINANSAAMFPNTLSMINQAGGGISLAPEMPVQGSAGSGTVFSDNKINQPIRAYVVETEITNSQKRVNRIERSVEF